MTSLNVFAVLLSLVATFFARSVTAMPVDESLQKRDVFTPPVLYPHNGTVWYSGQRHNVTWDTSFHPVNITNKIGFIILRFGEIETPLVLADNFNILDGRVEITVPYVLSGTDFSVVLFGDSGNWSDQFEIIGK